jgi:hypothetical protein
MKQKLKLFQDISLLNIVIFHIVFHLALKFLKEQIEVNKTQVLHSPHRGADHKAGIKMYLILNLVKCQVRQRLSYKDWGYDDIIFDQAYHIPEVLM